MKYLFPCLTVCGRMSEGVVYPMKSSEFIKALSIITQVGLTVAACILVGVFLGRFLDNLLGTSPWLLLLLSLLGVGAAFKSLFDLIPKPNEKSKKEQAKDKDK